MSNIQELDQKYIANTYKRYPITLVSGKGSLVRDEQGKEYIDMGAGIAVTSFGVADELWREAVIAQITRVQHTSNLYYTAPCARLAEALCQRTGMKKVFFSNSGAEANECAVKAARKYASETKGSEYSTIITLKNSFHGRTITMLAATGQEHFHQLYRPLTPGFIHAEAGNLEQLQSLADTHKTAAVMIECVQGEGGVVALDGEYIRALREFTAERNILLIVDEVQTGNGRTGKLYSYMNYGIAPDIVSTAKGLAGGLPLGVTLLGEKVQDVFSYGDHGSTFGGNPVACAAALSILERIDDALLTEVTEKGNFLREKFQAAPGIESVDGLGLMLGLKTTKPAGDVVMECLKKGVLCLTAKDRIRLLPALNIPPDLLERAAQMILDCANPAG